MAARFSGGIAPRAGPVIRPDIPLTTDRWFCTFRYMGTRGRARHHGRRVFFFLSRRPLGDKLGSSEGKEMGPEGRMGVSGPTKLMHLHGSRPLLSTREEDITQREVVVVDLGTATACSSDTMKPWNTR